MQSKEDHAHSHLVSNTTCPVPSPHTTCLLSWCPGQAWSPSVPLCPRSASVASNALDALSSWRSWGPWLTLLSESQGIYILCGTDGIPKVLEKAWGVSLSSHEWYVELGASLPAQAHQRSPRAGEQLARVGNTYLYTHRAVQ